MKSVNTRLDFTVKAQLADGKSGNVVIGDKSFEFYNDKNDKNCIQIPWNRIVRIRCVTLNQMVIHIYIEYGQSVLSLSSKDNISLLKWMRRYVERERFIQEKTYTQKITGKA